MLKDHLWLNPYAKHFSAMKASDLVLVDPEGYVVEGGNQAVINTAGFLIHSSVHRARPDVHAACHVHSMHGKTWSAFGKPVEMLTQGMVPDVLVETTKLTSDRCLQVLQEARRLRRPWRDCSGCRGRAQHRQRSRAG